MRKRITVTLSVVSTFRNSEINNSSSPRTTITSCFMCVSLLVHILNPCKPLSNLLRVQLFYPLSTNLLYWVHWAHIPDLLGLGYELWSYNKYEIIIYYNKSSVAIIWSNYFFRLFVIHYNKIFVVITYCYKVH